MEETQLVRRRWNLSPIIHAPQELEELDEVAPNCIGLPKRYIAASGFLDDPTKLSSALGRKDGHRGHSSLDLGICEADYLQLLKDPVVAFSLP